MAAGLFQDFDPIETIASNRYGLSVKKITRGTLLSFHYPHSFANPPNPIHDKYPMLIVTDIWPKYIRGVNLHYLTFPYIKTLLEQHGEKASAAYSNIKSDAYVARAFRMYYRMGVFQPRKLDVEFLKLMLKEVRNFSPNEIERIRNEIESQIQKRLQVRADELSSFEHTKREAIARSKNWDQLRSTLSKSQQQALNRRVGEIEQAVTRGPREGLIYPAQSTGPYPANTLPQPGEGGSMSTKPNV